MWNNMLLGLLLIAVLAGCEAQSGKMASRRITQARDRGGSTNAQIQRKPAQATPQPLSDPATVTLAWNANPDPQVVGYRVYKGTASRVYNQVFDAGMATNYTVTGLTIGTNYFFAVKDYVAVGFESAYSSEVQWKPQLPTPTPTASPSPTPTATTTPTPTASPSATATPMDTRVVGVITYCGTNEPMKNVTVLITGDVNGSTLTDRDGRYEFAVPDGANYNITPSKPAFASGTGPINTIDGIAVMSFYLALTRLGCESSGDANGDAMVDTLDVVAIQRFTLGFETGLAFVGQYRFAPVKPGSPNFIGALIGDVQ